MEPGYNQILENQTMLSQYNLPLIDKYFIIRGSHFPLSGLKAMLSGQSSVFIFLPLLVPGYQPVLQYIHTRHIMLSTHIESHTDSPLLIMEFKLTIDRMENF